MTWRPLTFVFVPIPDIGKAPRIISVSMSRRIIRIRHPKSNVKPKSITPILIYKEKCAWTFYEKIGNPSWISMRSFMASFTCFTNPIRTIRSITRRLNCFVKMYDNSNVSLVEPCEVGSWMVCNLKSWCKTKYGKKHVGVSVRACVVCG